MLQGHPLGLLVPPVIEVWSVTVWGELLGVCIHPMKSEWLVISASQSQSGVDEGIDWGVGDDADATTTNGLGLDTTCVNLFLMSLHLTYQCTIIDLPSL